MQIPHHPDAALWIAIHTGPRHHVTLTPRAHQPIAVRNGVEYLWCVLRCSDDEDENVTCLEPAVYARYVRARDEALAVPELPAKTDMRWDLDPYATAQRLTAHRARPLTLADHPWPEHAPAVQAIERWCQRMTVKVEFICTCGFRDGVMIDAPGGRLTFEDYPPVAATTTQQMPSAIVTQMPMRPAPNQSDLVAVPERAHVQLETVTPSQQRPHAPTLVQQARLHIRDIAAVLTVPTDALRRARRTLTDAMEAGRYTHHHDRRRTRVTAHPRRRRRTSTRARVSL